MDGIIPLWKPKGMTSHDCVQKIRKIFKTRKVGHTGTLDPMVEGVLPLCLNQATKLVPFLTVSDKTYIAQVKLGIATETEDAHGEVIETKELLDPPQLSEIDEVLQSFEGKITQIPPMYSAVRVKGKRLYEYARQNIPVERPKREVTIHQINRIGDLFDGGSSFEFKVECSSGTYIRTLCVDIGKQLGYPAHMSFLERISSGNFTKQEAVSFDDIETYKDEDNLEKLVYPMLHGLQHMSRMEVDQSTRQEVSYGRKLVRPDDLPVDEPFLLTFDNQLIAIYQADQGNLKMMKPVRVFIT